jgi:hypothetical protein
MMLGLTKRENRGLYFTADMKAVNYLRDAQRVVVFKRGGSRRYFKAFVLL